MTTDIVECLRGRREFYNYDPGRWMMSDKPDRDCQAAADEIERLRVLLAQSREIRAAWARLAAAQTTLPDDLAAALNADPFSLYESD